ncbi:thioredoxin domain-containing protein [Myceligenerans pegani]|uniref:Thioredoxin domain-containing protein n=1 Tax=Myceligenerans pegani TaxID=2776917 RepID=A0ABR9MX50_9MICO|nr:thioredoxin domain-containing protein [Myceligenerans sp. TRM 65318]MBE1875571.1 thioredoxin domain-containing protein [Myceligenerans sp. TRM 65318]MBE3017842.1 thioredoxin domain-containing protein [Myceligenerans sp. TRM 65318]
MPNRLATATSPYLLQHADNPVDWREWGDDAFAEARRRGVPVLLSVGYAACHWCHVMAHESFEDAAVAAAVNGRFVAVKVDREERPDVDAVYMAATTALTGQGGWPMTCFLTPDGEPFHCGTYYPREQFLTLLDAITEAWTRQRDAVVRQGTAIADAVARRSAPITPEALDPAALDRAARLVARDADQVRGGFGGAPKFPPSMTLEHLLRHHARTGDAESLRIVERTCEAMARGGIYDQLAGGFARYAVDADWVVPHFEKMLYDNAQLLRVHLHLHRATGSPLAERVARETAAFLLADLRTPEGGFASALDADTDGVEGLTYVWWPQQLREILGPDDGARAAHLLSVTPEGTFEHGASTLQLREDPDPDWWAAVRSRLAGARAARPQPARDDKVVTAWNGLAIAALAEAGAVLGEGAYVAAARECAELVLRLHVVDGRLRRASRGGVVGAAPGVAADHGDLAEGLLALHQATGEPRWLEAAGDLLDVALARFADDAGGFFDVADDAERLLSRPKDPTDGPEPAGQSSLAGALGTYAALTGSTRHREAAEAAVTAAGGLVRQAPRFAGWTLAAAEALAAGPLQVAVVGHDDAERAALERVARRATTPGLVIAVGEPDAPGAPLLAGRPLVDGRAAAYVCRGFVCDRPVTTPEDLAGALGA